MLGLFVLVEIITLNISPITFFFQKCSFCKVKGGSIGCGNSWCKKSYHYGCGKDNGAMFTYHGNYR